MEARHPPGPGELAETAEALMSERGFDHRSIGLFTHPPAPETRKTLESEGFRLARHIWMVHSREPHADRSGGRAEELALHEHAAAKDVVNRREPWVTGDDVAEQLMERDRRVAEATTMRAFGVRREGGPAAICELYVEGELAQVEDVSTLREHRGEGLASAVVLEAVRAARDAGVETVFLVADADDWPRLLYGRLGFDPVGLTHHFVRTPDA